MTTFPVTPEASASLGAASPPVFSLISLVVHADIVVQGVMLLLMMASVWCWALIFDKSLRFRGVMRRGEAFEKKFWSGQLLDQLYEHYRYRPEDPLTVVFVAGMQEWHRLLDSGQSLLPKGQHPPRMAPILVPYAKERIHQALSVAIQREYAFLEKHLGTLATVGSSAPFIGLFGTVWGIMHSFQSIAASKNATLAVVAPGIAEALLATAIGLFAAIPAVIFYNLLQTKLAHIAQHVEFFACEFETIISREMEKDARFVSAAA